MGGLDHKYRGNVVGGHLRMWRVWKTSCLLLLVVLCLFGRRAKFSLINYNMCLQFQIKYMAVIRSFLCARSWHELEYQTVNQHLDNNKMPTGSFGCLLE